MATRDSDANAPTRPIPYGGRHAQTTGAESHSSSTAQSARISATLLPAVSLPKGGGAIRGIGEKFAANPATGSGSLTVPIATSPGRSGFELALDLTYDSASGNGPFGIGWSLSTPSITRKTEKGLPRYADAEESDIFILSGAEDLVPTIFRDGTEIRPGAFDQDGFRVQSYRPRTEGLFARIERWTDHASGDVHWRVTTADNLLNIYGRSPAARIADPDHPERVFSWLLEETRDDRGNIAHYSYKAEDASGIDPGTPSEANRFELSSDGSARFRTPAQRYLKRVRYGNRSPVMDREAPAPAGDDDWLFEVVFDYGEHDDAVPTPAESRAWPVRGDPFSSFRPTFDLRTYRLCRRVLMFHRFAELGPTPCLVRSTDFTYDEGPVVTYLAAVTQAGYKREPADDAYERAALPPLELTYRRPDLHHDLHVVDHESLDGIPGGVDGADAQWVDLDGEGIPGVLIPSEGAWFYKRNLGGGALAAATLQRALPAPATLRDGAQQLTDLGGDGNLDLVQYMSSPGYFERTTDGSWSPFVELPNIPNIDWNDPDLRFIDVDGDGFADVLITEHEALRWYRSRAKQGFDPAARAHKPKDELAGAAVVFSDAAETIHLADMSGDGLMDIVRVRNGEVSYWPNLGYGKFGRKVTLDRSSLFDTSDQFDPQRVRFADIDGSGTTDLVYLGREAVRLYFNQSGNALSEPADVRALPLIDSVSSLAVIDLLGSGTACLVWSSPLPAERSRPLAYVDLMGGRKPHLLETVVNNLGAETRIAYAPSTSFYLQDEAAGRPWLTRLPFPVHVIERMERYDHVAKSKLVTTFTYRHGCFDGIEREFAGFARVEQRDAESFGAEREAGLFPEADDDPGDEALKLPPVRTVTWFHTGAWLHGERLEAALATEYYAQDPLAPLLRDTTLPPGLSILEERATARAMRGQTLRQEIYAEDGRPEAVHPYVVTERDYEARLLQHASERRHAVVFVHPKHTLNLHYEREPADPRIHHEVVLAVDDFGNIRRSAAIAYPRRAPVEPEQTTLWATVTEATVANRVDERESYRIGVPIETVTSELVGLVAPAGGMLSHERIDETFASARPLDYEGLHAPPDPQGQRRIIERDRRLYYADDLGGPLPLGDIGPRALPYETYRQVFTTGLVSATYGPRVDDDLLEQEGRYVQWHDVWWAPSGRTVLDPVRFYLPVEAIDPFDQHHRVRYDDYALLVVETEDPLGNLVTAGARDAAGGLTETGHDYRVLAPTMVSDANRNRVAAELDALGMVVKTAVLGKPGSSDGDTLADPTTRIEYDLFRWKNSARQLPVFIHTLAREQHGAGNPRWQETYSYSDGSGREVMRKVQAEAGAVPVLDADGQLRRNPDGSIETHHIDSRWAGTGRLVLDNKANPVKKYEPYFSDTFEYEDEEALVASGVTEILRYDPLSRLVQTDHPNGTHARVLFNAWHQETWDENDTVEGTPWLARNQAGTAAEQRCAALALAHAGTPTIARLDALGRVFLTISDNGAAGQRLVRVELDVEGNERTVTDPRGNTILHQVFDMTARPIRVVRADAGAWDAVNQRRAIPVADDPGGSLTLFDAANKAVRVWDERGHLLRRRHDELQRPTHLFVQSAGAAETLTERTVYGEAHEEAESRNLRTRAHQSYDGAGVLTHTRFDFRGQLVESTRRLAIEYHDTPDWTPLAAATLPATIASIAEPMLDAETFTTVAAYDALDRLTSFTTSDGSETRRVYNDASLLERLDVRIRGAELWTPFITGVAYNARAQRLAVDYGNGTRTEYTYDDETFRLVQQRTTRATDNVTLRDLTFGYDPASNIVSIEDGISFGNTGVSASGLYEYDALYQLTRAEGREHPAPQPAADEPVMLRVDHPNDMQALRRFRESYVYDPAGNIERVIHQTLEEDPIVWTRRHRHAPDSNRLLATNAPGDPPGALSATYEYDAAGSIVSMPHLPEMRWDARDRLQMLRKQIQNGPGPPNNVYFAYDASGLRIRKVYEHGGLIEERIYLGTYEVYRKRHTGATEPELDRQTLHVMIEGQRVALVETKSIDTSSPAFALTTRQRFQVENQLGSSMMELDETGTVISYEEYSPFGSTSFHAFGATGVSAKRYRYTAKERDEETGLYYYGQRYYAPWLARWISTDDTYGPNVGPWNLYWYCSNNPVSLMDPDGRDVVVLPDSRISAQRLVEMIRAQAQIPQAVRNAITVDPADPNRIVFADPGRVIVPDAQGEWRDVYEQLEIAARQNEWAFTTGAVNNRQSGQGANLRNFTLLTPDLPPRATGRIVTERLGGQVTQRFQPNQTSAISPQTSGLDVTGITLPSESTAAAVNSETRAHRHYGGRVVSDATAGARGVVVAADRFEALPGQQGMTFERTPTEIVETFFHELGVHAGGMSQPDVPYGHGRPDPERVARVTEQVGRLMRPSGATSAPTGAPPRSRTRARNPARTPPRRPSQSPPAPRRRTPAPPIRQRNL